MAVQIAYRTGPLVPLLLVAIVAVGTIAVVRPMASLYLAAAAIPLELFSLRLGFAGISPAEAGFVITGLGWSVRRLARGHLPYTPSPLGKPLLLLLLAVLPGLAVASDSASLLKTLVMWTMFFLVYQMIVAEARPELVRRLLVVLAVSGAIVGLIAIVTAGGQTQQLIGGGATATNRAIGSFRDPNALASFLALTIPGALLVGLQGSAVLRALGLTSFVLAFVGLSLSLSRGGLLAAAGAIGVMLAWPPVRWVAGMAAAVLVVLTLFNANPLGDVQQVQRVITRVSTVTYSGENQANQRIKLWRTTPQIVADHPFFGVGERQYVNIAARYGLIGPGGITFKHAHNIPLTIVAELGLVGLLALLWFFVALVRVTARACRETVGAERGLSFAVAAALVSVALQGLVDYTIGSNVMAALVFVLAGCAVVMSRAGAPSASAAGLPVPGAGPPARLSGASAVRSDRRA